MARRVAAQLRRTLREGGDLGTGVEPDQAVMARALAGIYLTGPTVALAALVLPHSSRTDEVGILVLIAAAYAVVPLLFALYRRLPKAAFQLVVALANVLVTLVIWFSGEAHSFFAPFYLWATPFAFCFFSLRQAALQVAAVGLLYAGVLFALDQDGRGGPDGEEPARWLLVLSTLAVVGVLVRALTAALRTAAARHARERERRAREINDAVVQGLAVAKYSLAEGDTERAARVIDDSLERARRIITDQLGETQVRPGDLAREDEERDPGPG